MAHATSRHAAISMRFFISAMLIVGALGACGGTAPAASTGSPTAAATVTPSARPSSSTSAGPNPDAGAALDAFRAFVQTEQSFHIAGDMLMTVGDLTLQAAILSDVSQGNEQGTIDLRGAGVSVRGRRLLEPAERARGRRAGAHRHRRRRRRQDPSLARREPGGPERPDVEREHADGVDDL